MVDETVCIRRSLHVESIELTLLHSNLSALTKRPTLRLAFG